MTLCFKKKLENIFRIYVILRIELKILCNYGIKIFFEIDRSTRKFALTGIYNNTKKKESYLYFE